jgi:translocation and assembly module TamA
MAEQKPQVSSRLSVGRGVARLLLLGLLAATAGAAALPAYAIEIFGIKLFESDDEEAEDIADPLNYTVTLEVTGGDADLKETLEDVSSLVQDAERPVSGSLGLMAKARGDREQLVAALYTQARYDGVVEIAIDGKPLDELPPDAEFGAGPVPVAIEIDAGGVFTLGEVALQGDAADLVPAEFGLIPGGDAGSNAILKAEAEIVRRLKEEGRPLATVTGRDVVADHATLRLDVTLTVAAGPIAAYGETTVTGTELVDRDFTGYMAGLERGRIYSPEELDDARDRLVNLGVFSSVTVKEAEALDANGDIPIGVEVSERKMRYYGVGGTISNTEGLGLEGYWGHRNLFGRAEKLRIEGAVGRIGDTDDYSELNYNAGIMFEKPGVIGPDSKFFSNLKAVSEHPDAYDRFSVKGGVGLSYQFTKTQTASVELSVDYSDIEDFYNPDGARHLLVSIPLQYVFDNRDDRLNPTKGFRAAAFAEPTYDTLTGSTFVKLRGDASTYWALDQASKFVIAGRVAVGSILGAQIAEIPADRRFYAGGGGSVRGYAYQGIGPKDPLGNPTGGRSFAETSVELRFQVTDNFGIVPFIDAGTVSEGEYPDFSDVKVGAGVGIRYLTPFGPLRVDAAVPLNKGPGDPDFGIYAGVGQAF